MPVLFRIDLGDAGYVFGLCFVKDPMPADYIFIIFRNILDKTKLRA